MDWDTIESCLAAQVGKLDEYEYSGGDSTRIAHDPHRCSRGATSSQDIIHD